MTNSLPSENSFSGENLFDDWKLHEEVGRGNHGVVYRATRAITDEIEEEGACKIIPKDTLIDGWEKEIEKSEQLDKLQNVVDFKDFDEAKLNCSQYVCIIYEFVEGPTLEEYIKDRGSQISLSTTESIISDILEVLYAMEELGINHGDLHAGNVFLSENELLIRDNPVVMISDFGIGCSKNFFEPKNDYAQLADIALDLLNAIDKEELGSRDRYHYSFLRDEFIDKKLLEEDPTKGEFVRSPDRLREILLEGTSRARERLEKEQNVELENPFDYLSCEQMGDSFNLIERLYSKNFPGYNQVQSLTNTILTGPRGCGKTTIFRNMATKTKVESNSLSGVQSLEYLGVYYPCRDLYFAFHFLNEDPSEENRALLIHYFSLSLLKELIDTLGDLREEHGLSVSRDSLEEFGYKLDEWIECYSKPPKGADILEHLSSALTNEKRKVGKGLRKNPHEKPDVTIPVDFLPKIAQNLINDIDQLSEIPVFFLIDDYSLPKISKGMQKTLNDLIFERWDQIYFKVSTESITAFHPYDSSEKTLEESREFETVDLAAYFIRSQEKRKSFVSEVINTRLQNTTGINDRYTELQKILGENSYDSYNDLARKIRSDANVKYGGYETICDLFSGDLSEILRLVRGMFEEAGTDEEWNKGEVNIPLDHSTQDEAIRDSGARFLNKINSVPETGTSLRSVSEKFGEISNKLLMEEDSSNQGSNPPKQAFRIEIRDSFSFETNQDFAEVAGRVRKATGEDPTQKELVEKTQDVYKDLLRYGVFLLDVRGKSIRGDVVPRLYLRRLLLPKFNLTPSQRDNVSMESSDFLHLLANPDNFSLDKDHRPEDSDLSDYSNGEGGMDQ